MTRLRTWYGDRSLREKRLLVVMVALLVVTIIWAGIIIPVRDGLDSSRARYEDAVVRLATTRGEVDLVKSASRRPPLSAGLAETVRAMADQAGFEIATLDQQDGGRVHVTIQSAKPGAMAAWLARLEAAGVLVDSATLRDTGSRSVAADLILKARGA